MFAMRVNVFPLKLNDGPSFMCLQRPHRGSLHFVTLNFVSWVLEHFALVSSFLRFGDWRLLFRNTLCLYIDFILSFLKRIDLFCRISGNISGLFGLNVVTYGIKLLSALLNSFGWSRSGLFNALTFNILSWMRAGGYFCFERNVFNFSSLVSNIFSTEMIILNLLARLYDMLFLVCFGWHDV